MGVTLSSSPSFVEGEGLPHTAFSGTFRINQTINDIFSQKEACGRREFLLNSLFQFEMVLGPALQNMVCFCVQSLLQVSGYGEDRRVLSGLMTLAAFSFLQGGSWNR